MSNPILSSILPTNGTPGTGLTGSAATSSSIPPTSSSIPTSSGSTSSGTTPLPPPASTTSSTLIPTSSSLPSINATSITSSTEIPTSSTSPPPLTSTSTSFSPTEISSSTTIVTIPSGNASTSTSIVPTTFINSPSDSNDLVSRRTAVIAGTTIGLVAFVLMMLAAIFVYRRRKLRKTMDVSGKKREGRGLLDGEEFDDDERNISSMQTYHDRRYPTHASHPATSSALSLLKSRTSETGSIFREEVWPPPGFIDPISKQSSQVDLSSIVDDVMGPSTSYAPSHSSSSLTTSYPGSSIGPDERRQPTDASAVSTISSTSTAPLITGKYSDPFQPNSGPSIRTPSPLLSDASVPATPRALSTVSYPTVAPTLPIPSLPPPARPQPRFPNTQPQKSSPLARTLTADNLWLTRNVRPYRTEPRAPP